MKAHIRAVEQIDEIARECDNLRGFVITHALTGGTGSGLATELQFKLFENYGKKPRISFTILGRETDTLGYYNQTVGIACAQYTGCLMCCVENETLFRQCGKLGITGRLEVTPKFL